MGSKQSSSSEFKRQYGNSSQIKNMRKLSEDLSSKKYFTTEETQVDMNLSSDSRSVRSEPQLKRPHSYANITTANICCSSSQ